ncbi:hypothetical protein MCHIJ_50590 [Mycolicibacterium chitae]|uniref:Secreted protein n=1 Tax=Mycolicibacterium chitae TaxID=1792 RepID=A0A448I9W6_MYCCI|nr:hypothetical protein [Mycolicibacterium chitae]MCV7105097.1 hypothetical protein [Mycolicibacterium chitae]BBZ05622.1 hypothetical protein MCHIJ_50590 [Mycolicibacterium chitae]VEG49234.1 Uncharacterised protein [Mycolicibacterium chitae]
MRKAFPLAVLAAGVTASLLVSTPAVASRSDGPRPAITESTYPWCDFDWYCNDDDLGVLLDEGPQRPQVDNDLPGRDRPDRDRPDRDRDRDRGGRR